MNYTKLAKDNQIALVGFVYCEVCGIKESEYKEGRNLKKATLAVHHKDTDTSNNELDNLLVCCRRCHAKEHLKIGNHTFNYNSAERVLRQLRNVRHPSQVSRHKLKEATDNHIKAGTHNSMQPGWISESSSRLRSRKTAITRRIKLGMEVPDEWYDLAEYYHLKKMIEQGIKVIV